MLVAILGSLLIYMYMTALLLSKYKFSFTKSFVRSLHAAGFKCYVLLRSKLLFRFWSRSVNSNGQKKNFGLVQTTLVFSCPLMNNIQTKICTCTVVRLVIPIAGRTNSRVCQVLVLWGYHYQHHDYGICGFMLSNMRLSNQLHQYSHDVVTRDEWKMWNGIKTIIIVKK